MQKKQKLWSEEGRATLASLPLEPWADRRRHDLLHLLSMLDGQLEKLNDAVTQVAGHYPDVHLLMSQPGVGAVTALAFVLTVGDVRSLPAWQASRQLSWANPSRVLIWRQTADGRDQQAGQLTTPVPFG